MADDLMNALRALANRWAMKARDYARTAKEPSASESQASYDRGFAEGYYRAATELAAVLKEHESNREARPRPASGAPPTGALPGRPTASPNAPAAPKPAPAARAAPTVHYVSVSVGDALSILEFAGLAVRDITQNKDNSFRLVFSRWENMMPHERLERIQKADPRIVILNSGKLESADQFVELAFKDNETS